MTKKEPSEENIQRHSILHDYLTTVWQNYNIKKANNIKSEKYETNNHN